MDALLDGVLLTLLAAAVTALVYLFTHDLPNQPK